MAKVAKGESLGAGEVAVEDVDPASVKALERALGLRSQLLLQLLPRATKSVAWKLLPVMLKEFLNPKDAKGVPKSGDADPKGVPKSRASKVGTKSRDDAKVGTKSRGDAVAPQVEASGEAKGVPKVEDPVGAGAVATKGEA